MTFAEINRRFSDIIADYLGKGWVINTSGVTAGYSGEKMRVELTNGKDIIAVRLVEDFGGLFSGRTVNIVVGIARESILRKHHVTPNRLGHESLWADCITELSREPYYCVGDRYCSNWFSTKEEQEKAKEIRRARQMARDDRNPKEIDLTEMRGAKEIALRWIQRTKYSSYKLKDIQSVIKCVYEYDGETYSRYRITAREKCFCVNG